MNGDGLSKCLFEESIPANSSCNWEKYSSFECTFYDQCWISQTILESLIMGYDRITEVTKCKVKCIKELFTISGELKMPMRALPIIFFPKLRGSTTIVMLNKHPNKSIKLLKQVKNYSFWDFVADSGGILGVFLGFSFLGTFETFITKKFATNQKDQNS